MEKTIRELGYLDALEKLGMAPPQDAMTKEAQGRIRGAMQAAKGIFGGAGRQVQFPSVGKPTAGPGLLRRGWDRLTKGRNVTLPPPPVPGAARGAAPAARGAAPAVPKAQAPAAQAAQAAPGTQRPPRAKDTLLAEQEMAAAARGSAPATAAPTAAATEAPSFLRRHGGTAALLGGGAAAGAYGMSEFDQYARRPDPYTQPSQYYSAIPGGSPYGGY